MARSFWSGIAAPKAVSCDFPRASRYKKQTFCKCLLFKENQYERVWNYCKFSFFFRSMELTKNCAAHMAAHSSRNSASDLFAFAMVRTLSTG